MNSIFRSICILLTCSGLGTLSAQESYFRNVYEPKSGSYVEVVALFSKLPNTGYAPIRVTIANRTSVPVSVSLSFESVAGSEYYNSGAIKVKSSFTAGSPAGTVTTSDFLVPMGAMVKNSAYSGHQNQQTLAMSMVGVSNGGYTHTTYTSQTHPTLLMSEALSTPNASALDAEINKGSGGGYSPGNYVFAGKFNPTQMPDDWRAYVGYDGMILTDQDWNNLPPGARSAILQWNRLGGYLRILTTSSSSTLNSLSISSESNSNPLARGKGYVHLTSIPSTLALDAAKFVKEMNTNSIKPKRQHEWMIDDYSSSGWGLQSSLGNKTFHFVMFILVLIAFGILVGPVNLFVFAKSGKRHKLFITTPIIAIGASAAMIALIFVQDGLGGKGLRVQWMELTQENGDNNAYIHQEQISRSGVLIGNRFQLSEPCSISPLPLAASQWTRLNVNSNTDQAFEINFIDKGMQVSGDWFQSRSEQAQMLTAVVPTRARIEFTTGGNETALLSNFEYGIDRFFMRGKGGKFWKAEQIAAGKGFLCSECSQAEYEQFVKASTLLLGKNQREDVTRLSFRDGYYIAVTEAAPMLETYSAIRWQDDHTIITGRVQNPETP